MKKARELTAYHEAAHAVVAYLNGAELMGVSMKGMAPGLSDAEKANPYTGTGGVEGVAGVAYGYPDFDSRPDALRAMQGPMKIVRVEGEMMVALAGPAADYRNTGDLQRSMDQNKPDWSGAVHMATLLSQDPEEVNDRVNTVFHRTVEVVNENWPAITALARRMKTKPRWTGEEATEVIERFVSRGNTAPAGGG